MNEDQKAIVSWLIHGPRDMLGWALTVPIGGVEWLLNMPADVVNALEGAPSEPTAVLPWIGATFADDPEILWWLASRPPSLDQWFLRAPSDLWVWLSAMPRT